MNQNNGQPVYMVLPEGTNRNTGRNAQNQNIEAAKIVAASVRTTLGPKGMDKMLVNALGDVIISNDGATILTEMDVDHPAAKMVVEVSQNQESEVGDGTTTVAVFMGELLKKSQELMEQNIHPSVLMRGFRLARDKSMTILKECSTPVTKEDRELLRMIALTALTGKSSETSKNELADLAVDAVISVYDGVNKPSIKIEKKQGAGIEESELVHGIILDKEITYANMPKVISNAKIAVLTCGLEVKEGERTAEIRVNTPEQLQAFLQQESEILKKQVSIIIASGATMVFTDKAIDDMALHYLSKRGISAIRRIGKKDIESISKATGAKIISDLEELTELDLGYAGMVEETRIGGENMTFIRDCKNPKAVSILVRGSTDHIADEAKRSMDDAVLGIVAALEKGSIVFGGGSIEMEVSRRLKRYADSVGGREQLAINAFAEALEIIPRTLAESTGRDPIDMLVELRKKHDSGETAYGVDVNDNAISDMKTLGVIEPLKTKTHAYTAATEATIMMLRIDDVIIAKSATPGPGGMPQQ